MMQRQKFGSGAVRGKSKSFPACNKLLDELTSAIQAGSSTEKLLKKLGMMASEQPEELQHGFALRVERLIPGVKSTMSLKDSALASALYGLIGKAAKHGPGVVPDIWIESLAGKAIRGESYEAVELDPFSGVGAFVHQRMAEERNEKHGEKLFALAFYGNALAAVAEQAPKRIVPGTFDKVFDSAVTVKRQTDGEEALRAISYATLHKLLIHCGCDMLTATQKRQIDDDVEGYAAYVPELRKNAGETYRHIHAQDKIDFRPEASREKDVKHWLIGKLKL
jgi:hypothetical protein